MVDHVDVTVDGLGVLLQKLQAFRHFRCMITAFFLHWFSRTHSEQIISLSLLKQSVKRNDSDSRISYFIADVILFIEAALSVENIKFSKQKHSPRFDPKY